MDISIFVRRKLAGISPLRGGQEKQNRKLREVTGLKVRKNIVAGQPEVRQKLVMQVRVLNLHHTPLAENATRNFQ